MPYPYSITTRTDGEIITHTKYNADHQNHIDHQIPADSDDYSANVTEMRVQTNPGGVGSESLATNLAGELERLRYVLAQRFGLTYWYQVAGSTSAVKGVQGVNNATTPTTKYDLSAMSIVAGTGTSGGIVDINNVVYTVDITQAGPVLNGRDQASAFSANSFIHIYHITNGSTPGLIASPIGPNSPLGPVMPSGYLHHAYLTTLRLNASTQFLRTRTINGWVMYELDSDAASANRVLTDGVQTTFTDVDLSALVPSQALKVLLSTRLLLTHNATGVFTLFVRPNGAAHVANGIAVCAAPSAVNGVQTSAVNWVTLALPSDRIVEYKLSAAPATSGGAILDVMGYGVPNGAE